MSKWWFSLFPRILFPEPLKLSRDHPEVPMLKIDWGRSELKMLGVYFEKKKHTTFWKNLRNTYFRNYSILLPEPPVHCHHFFVFWTMIHQVLRFLSWKYHFEQDCLKMTFKFKWTQGITLSLMKNIIKKFTAPNNYTGCYEYIVTKLPGNVARGYF